MDIHRLVKMANEIGSFFESASDRKEAVASIAAHLRNFWEPRMRTQLIEYAHQGDGELKDVVKEAVLSLDGSRPAA
jgi:formate dehydrogenase subunit delta